MTMNAHREGSGEPLVLVHGVGSRWQAFAAVIGPLATRFDVIAVDLPGFGASPPDGTLPSIEAQAERLEAEFAALGVERPHVAGNSMGGAIALELARRGSVRSATAVSPAGFWTPREREFCIASVRSSLRSLPLLRPVLPTLFSTAAGKLAYAQYFSRPWRLGDAECVETADAIIGSASTPRALELFREHVFHDAEELRGVPVTIAWGTRDRLLIPRQARRARRVLPWATHVSLPGCGHVPFPDDPERLTRALADGALAAA